MAYTLTAMASHPGIHTDIITQLHTQFFQQLDLAVPTVVLSTVVPFYDPTHEHYC